MAVLVLCGFIGFSADYYVLIYWTRNRVYLETGFAYKPEIELSVFAFFGFPEFGEL